MTDPADSPDLDLPPEPPEPTPRKKGHPLLAWIAIAALVVITVWHPWESHVVQAGEPGNEQIDLIMLRLQGRYMVGAAGLFGQKQQREQLYEQIKLPGTASVGLRLRAVVLAGELVGPKKAIEQIDVLRQDIAGDKAKGSPEDLALVGVLERLYQDYVAGDLDPRSVSDDESAQLGKQLGWFGQLALAPEGGPDAMERATVLAPARKTALTVLGGFSALAAVGLFGFTGLVVFLVLLAVGRLHDGITGPFLYGGVYAETFAVWMGLFIGLSYLASRIDVPGPPLLLAAGVSLGCLLLALAWPLLRGVPLARLRQDVGLTLGRNPPLEPALGVACYAMALPLLVVGALLTFGLVKLQEQWYAAHPDLGPAPAPSHPIVRVFGHINLSLLLQLLILASVIAPIVEETMFRGLLYRHLRELTGREGRVISIGLSALAVSFVFAVIHPQGWVAIPALMALAVGFSLMREWRGTLIPSMVAHGLNNGLLLLLFYVAVGS